MNDHAPPVWKYRLGRLSSAERSQIRRLRARYPRVTTFTVALLAEKVDRSLVSKVWGGVATSSYVLLATWEAFRAAGWTPASEPSWLLRARETLQRVKERRAAS